MSQCTIGPLMAGAAPPLMILVTGEGLKKYPREMFGTGDLLAMPFSARTYEGGGVTINNGALLLKVKAVYRTREEAFAAEPDLAEQIEKQRNAGQSSELFSGIPFDSERGLAKISSSKGTASMGPIHEGWTQADKQDALELTKAFLLALGSLDLNCFVATAVYGDSKAPELTPLRRFRDEALLKTSAGRRLVAHYYRYGSSWASWVKARPWAANLIRAGLDRVSAYLARTDPGRLAANPLLRAGIRAGAYLVGGPTPDKQPPARSWVGMLYPRGESLNYPVGNNP